MPASSDRLGVSSLRPCNPAENDPADPNALTQLLQLTCSLTPSSTVPSTRLVIIWLKRWPARSPIEPALEPVGHGGKDVAEIAAEFKGTLSGVGVEVEVDVEHGVDWANAAPVSPPRSNSDAAITRVAKTIQ